MLKHARSLFLVFGFAAALFVSTNLCAQDGCWSYTNDTLSCPSPQSVLDNCRETACTGIDGDGDGDGIFDDFECPRDGEKGVIYEATPEEQLYEFADIEVDWDYGRPRWPDFLVICYQSETCGPCSADATGTGKHCIGILGSQQNHYLIDWYLEGNCEYGEEY